MNRMQHGKIRLLTEAGPATGMGHLMRMRGLKERLLEDGYPAEMHVQQEDVQNKVQLLPHENDSSWINDSEAVNRIAEPEDILVMDTYKTELHFINSLTKRFRQVIVIDDTNRLEYENTIVINPNYYGAMMDYPEGNGNTYFLGKDYTLLRPDFKYNGNRKINASVKRILITMGGSDVLRMTEKIIAFCHSIDSETSLDIVVTNQFSNLQEIREAVSDRDVLHFNLSAREMNRLMNEADFAIAAAGGTSNELIKTQCPSIVIKVADNQELNVRYLAPLNYFRLFDADHLERIRDMYSREVRQSIYDVLDYIHTDKSAKDAVEYVFDNM